MIKEKICSQNKENAPKEWALKIKKCSQNKWIQNNNRNLLSK